MDILHELEKVIRSRRDNPPEGSYVASLLKGGPDKFLRKINEEAGELILAAKNGDNENIVHETADLLFHMLVLLSHYDITLDEVESELEKRRPTPTP